MIIWTQHTGDSFIEPPDLFLCTWYLVPWSLYFICCFATDSDYRWFVNYNLAIHYDDRVGDAEVNGNLLSEHCCIVSTDALTFASVLRRNYFLTSADYFRAISFSNSFLAFSNHSINFIRSLPSIPSSPSTRIQFTSPLRAIYTHTLLK